MEAKGALLHITDGGTETSPPTPKVTRMFGGRAGVRTVTGVVPSPSHCLALTNCSPRCRAHSPTWMSMPEVVREQAPRESALTHGRGGSDENAHPQMRKLRLGEAR